MLEHSEYINYLYKRVEKAYKGSFNKDIFISHSSRRELYRYFKNPELKFDENWIFDHAISLFYPTKHERLALQIMGLNLLSMWLQENREKVPPHWTEQIILPLIQNHYYHLQSATFLSLVDQIDYWLKHHTTDIDQLRLVNASLLPVLEHANCQEFKCAILKIYNKHLLRHGVFPSILLHATILFCP
mmetsp:Transcript_14224/g.21503  ORF Transcript_14224/g.21503 Transcript_14224/m.21503 type:complete len:187 (+) Transcript_14224:2129-2689(+)